MCFINQDHNDYGDDADGTADDADDGDEYDDDDFDDGDDDTVLWLKRMSELVVMEADDKQSLAHLIPIWWLSIRVISFSFAACDIVIIFIAKYIIVKLLLAPTGAFIVIVVYYTSAARPLFEISSISANIFSFSFWELNADW